MDLGDHSLQLDVGFDLGGNDHLRDCGYGVDCRGHRLENLFRSGKRLSFVNSGGGDDFDSFGGLLIDEGGFGELGS